MKIVLNFEHIATRIPYNIQLTVKQNILYRLGFKGTVIDQAMSDFGISDYEYFFEGVTYA